MSPRPSIHTAPGASDEPSAPDADSSSAAAKGSPRIEGPPPPGIDGAAAGEESAARAMARRSMWHRICSYQCSSSAAGTTTSVLAAGTRHRSKTARRPTADENHARRRLSSAPRIRFNPTLTGSRRRAVAWAVVMPGAVSLAAASLAMLCSAPPNESRVGKAPAGSTAWANVYSGVMRSTKSRCANGRWWATMVSSSEVSALSMGISCRRAAMLLHSSSQPVPVASQNSCGVAGGVPAVETTRASAVTVLPRPGSSARMPPRTSPNFHPAGDSAARR
mmetsp:Transcript_4769/g.15663  ORF Transcript_4769/g.15663 Transcript_4769/m.15663 type:complete len:277 (-) Transcript_4769:444-1274(-)